MDIICPIHGLFSQKPGKHLAGHECHKCSVEYLIYLSSLKKKTKVNFVKEANLIHNNKYNYDLVIYTDFRSKVEIVCYVHGSFWQSPSHHLDGEGCPKCSSIARGRKRLLGIEKFIELANEVHNNYYDYSESIYMSAKTKIKIICPVHGVFEQTPDSHLSGSRGTGAGCPKCSHTISKGEIAWLDSLNIAEEYRRKTIKIGGKPYKVDAYNHHTNTIYEYNGDYWHGNPDVFDQNKIHPDKKITYGEVYSLSLKRELVLKDAGYIVISIWENDFKKINGGQVFYWSV
jgi:ssDNA-binding Zn-finger/Zn-ribbon topoisomerase 1